jgi:hypothetical protein
MSVSRRMPVAIAAMAASGFFVGSMAGVPAHAEEIAGTLLSSCREEVWRVRVMPSGGPPKNAPLPRYEKRSVLVCDERVFADVRRPAIAANSCPIDERT